MGRSACCSRTKTGARTYSPAGPPSGLCPAYVWFALYHELERLDDLVLLQQPLILARQLVKVLAQAVLVLAYDLPHYYSYIRDLLHFLLLLLERQYLNLAHQLLQHTAHDRERLGQLVIVDHELLIVVLAKEPGHQQSRVLVKQQERLALKSVRDLLQLHLSCLLVPVVEQVPLHRIGQGHLLRPQAEVQLHPQVLHVLDSDGLELLHLLVLHQAVSHVLVARQILDVDRHGLLLERGHGLLQPRLGVNEQQVLVPGVQLLKRSLGSLQLDLQLLLLFGFEVGLVV